MTTLPKTQRQGKRWGRRAHVWCKFSDGTSESFTVPTQLVYAIAPAVYAYYPPHVETWVEYMNHIIRPDDGDTPAMFTSTLRRFFGGVCSSKGGGR